MLDKKYLATLDNQELARELVLGLSLREEADFREELKNKDYHRIVYLMYQKYIYDLEDNFFKNYTYKTEGLSLDANMQKESSVTVNQTNFYLEHIGSDDDNIVEEKDVFSPANKRSEYVSDKNDSKYAEEKQELEKIIASSKKKESRHLILKTITIILLIIWALMVIFPFYYMIITSLKSLAVFNGEYIPTLYVTNPVLDNYRSAFEMVHLGKYMLNTAVFAVITTILMVVVSTLAAFGFARIKFKGRELVFTIFLALMMIPTELVVITNYTTIVNFGWRNTLVGLVLPSVTSVFYIYLLRENFMLVPDTMYMAAKVDGCSDMRYLLKVLVPINKPTIVSVTILKLIECWNAYIWPRLVTTEEGKYLVSNGIQMLRQSGFGRDNVPAMMAAVVVVSVPLIIIYLIFRKQIMAGVLRNGSKG